MTKALAAILAAGLLSGTGHAKILFKADFETGDLSQWNDTGTRGQNATPRNIQLVTDIVQEGSTLPKSRFTRTMCSTRSSCGPNWADPG